MELKRMREWTHPEFEGIWALYERSFPGFEKRNLADQKRAMEQAADYAVDLILEEGAVQGFVMYWQHQDFLYLEHFAVLEQARNKGYGSRVLEALKAKGSRIVLEIDPPEDEISLRRKGFYERCGFVANDYNYIHIPYKKEQTWYPLVLMTWPQAIDAQQSQSFSDFMKGHVAIYGENPPIIQ